MHIGVLESSLSVHLQILFDSYWWGEIVCIALYTRVTSAYMYSRAGTNTPSDEYDSYREYRVANTNMYSRIQFFSEAKLGNGLSVLVYACTMYSAQKFHFASLPSIL